MGVHLGVWGFIPSLSLHSREHVKCSRVSLLARNLATPCLGREPKASVATPLWAKCEDEAHTPKSGKLESSGTPKNSERDCRGQISSHLSVFGVIEKFLKRKCPKWPRMSHLDICSASYGQKKGQESNWQFDSRPLKVGNRLVSDVRSRSATWCWKALFEGYNFGLDLVPIQGWGEELWSPKVPGVQTGTISGLHFGSPGKMSHSDATPMGECREYYREYGGGISRVQSWCVLWVRVSPWLVPTPNACRMTSNQLVLVLNAGSWPNSLISS
jgi:hypothetical protein